VIAALITAAALVLLPAVWMWDVRRERERRAALFEDCMKLFGKCRVTQDGMHFPVLEGHYRGVPIKLEPVLDDMGVRKVPSLWLKATVLAPNSNRGVLDFIVRPQGIEFYSPSNDLPVRLSIPADWPQHALLCTDRRGTQPPLDRLTPHMSAFDDPRMKELLITPRGVRLVYQAAQAERGEYLVLRQARFAVTRIDPALVRFLLDRALAIATALDALSVPCEAKVA
jgi:hypothetical protein